MNIVEYSHLRFVVYLTLLLTLSRASAQIEWTEYPYPIQSEYRGKIRFGYLTVPETRKKANTRVLKIGFCVIKSTSEKPLHDAVLFLPGGPGGGMTQAVEYFFTGEPIQRILSERDVVLFDPRGCGTSDPQLCGELEKPEIFNAHLSGITQQEHAEILAAAMRFCRDSLQAAGIDLQAYGSADVADDVEDLRIALGYDQWNLRGHSYGTRYAQSVMRQYPSKVRSAILSGVVPSAPSYDDGDFYGLVRALRMLFEQCDKDEECLKEFPNLETQFLELLKKLENEPIILRSGVSPLLPERSIVISPFILLGGIFNAMYTREGFEMIPILIRTVAEGNTWITEPLAMVLGQDETYKNADMFQIIRCNDNPGSRFAPKSILNDRLVAALKPYWRGNKTTTEEELCATLAIPLDSAEQQPVRSDIPVLIYSGEFDPVTPPYYADSVAKYLSNATTMIVPGRGHDTPTAMAGLLYPFFKDPKTRNSLVPPASSGSANILKGVALNKGISALSVKIVTNDFTSLAIFLGIIVIALLSGFGYFSYLFFKSVFKAVNNPLKIRDILPIWTVLIISLAYLGLLAKAMEEGLSIHPYYLVFGLPEKWSIIFNITWLLLGAIIICTLLAKNIIREEVSKRTKIFWIISWLGGTGLLVLLLYSKIN